MIMQEVVAGTTTPAENFTCCFKNEQFTDEVFVCNPSTCERILHGPDITCYAILREDACECKDGYYRNSAYQCVTKTQCSEDEKNPPELPPNPQCGKNMQLIGCLQPNNFSICSSSFPSSCDSSCELSPLVKFIEQNRNSSLKLLNVCNCIEGYCLDHCGECVEKCNYQKNRSCNKCECPGANEVRRGTKCVCTSGYVRNKCGQCVTKEQLEWTQNCLCSCPCGINQMLRTCSQATERTCENFYNCPGQNLSQQNEVSCDCQPGYYSGPNGCQNMPSKTCPYCAKPQTNQT